MALTAAGEKDVQRATNCWIWEKELGVDMVRDHDHLNGKYRGAAHHNCSLDPNDKHWKLPVFPLQR